MLLHIVAVVAENVNCTYIVVNKSVIITSTIIITVVVIRVETVIYVEIVVMVVVEGVVIECSVFVADVERFSGSDNVIRRQSVGQRLDVRQLQRGLCVSRHALVDFHPSIIN